MKLALDTNRYADAARGVADIVQQIRFADQIILLLPVLAELRYGFLQGTRRAENERDLLQFRRQPRVTFLAPDEETADYFAAFRIQLKKQGTPIPINDIWIAAMVVQHNLVLATRDQHFQHLPQVRRI